MHAYVTNIMVVLIIFPVILQTVINFRMLSIEVIAHPWFHVPGAEYSISESAAVKRCASCIPGLIHCAQSVYASCHHSRVQAPSSPSASAGSQSIPHHNITIHNN